MIKDKPHEYNQVMKREIIVLSFVILSGWAMGQAPVRPHDTIYYREATYLYPRTWFGPYDTASYTPHGPCAVRSDGGSHECSFCYPYSTSIPLRIIGVAIGGEYLKASATPGGGVDTVCEQLQLFKCVHGHWTKVAETSFCFDSASRYLAHCHYWVGSSFPDAIYPIYEAFFDEPVDVTDSFYVGVTNRTYQAFTFNITGAANAWVIYALYHPDFDSMLVYGNSVNPVMLFPIFDTTGMDIHPYVPPCAEVENLHVAAKWGSNVMVEWNGSPDDNIEYYQMEVYSSNGRPEIPFYAGRVEDTSKSFFNLDTTAVYTVSVRAICRFSNSEWSTIQISWPNSGGEEPPIGMPEVREPFAMIVPNPASDMVTVATSCPQTQVEVHDLKGRKLTAKRSAGLTSAINVTGWPEGVYMVTIHTTCGTVSKKLAISR